MKIRGNTVGTPLKPEKVVVKCQNLTEEEKAQARANIGAAGIGEGGGGANIDDTNISTETTWSSQNIVEKLYPNINGKGAAVSCQPPIGYPLEVITHVPSEAVGETVTLRQVGKNLLRPGTRYKTTTTNGVTFTVNDDKSITIQTDAGGATNAATIALVGVGTGANAQPIKDLGILKDGITPYTMSTNFVLPNGVELWAYLYKPDNNAVTSYKIIAGGTAVTMYFTTADKVYIYLRVAQGTVITEPFTVYPMLENGTVMTEYEPYKCEEKTVTIPADALAGTYNWATGVFESINGDGGILNEFPQPITPYNGINTFFSSVGDTEVNGREDPYANIQRLWAIVNTLTGG